MAHPELDSFEALHAWLTGACGLVAERVHGGSWRTYFAGRVEWHPARSTRVLKVLLDHAGRPSRVQLCVSSDNNNSVLLHAPFDTDKLRLALDEEIRLLASPSSARQKGKLVVAGSPFMLDTIGLD